MAPDDLDPSQLHEGLAWEAPAQGRGAMARAFATAGQVLNDPEAAGRAVGAQTAVGRAVGFFALLGLPCAWATAVNEQLAQALHPDRIAWAYRFFHLPEPPTPTAQQMALAKVLGLVKLAVYPLLAALGILVLGALLHGGLWATRALGRGRGLEVTYRGLLYVLGATAWMLTLLSLAAWLPDRWFWLVQIPSLALMLGIFTLLGRVLAHAHGVEPWRGVVGVFAPLLACCCLCACCAGALGAMAAQGLR